MKYYLPIHLDGGNRGCEAIAKGTSLILKESKDNIIGLCTNVELDKKLGVDKYVSLVPIRNYSIWHQTLDKVYKLFVWEPERRKKFKYKYLYNQFLDSLTEQDVMLSTGGDMMCYGNNQVNYTVDYLATRGVKTILWGCSIGKNNLTPEKLHSLKHFSLIYARETLTQNVLAQCGINNVVVFPDPAFALQPEHCDLPNCFLKEKVIGINLSNFVMGGFALNTEFAAEVKKLIDYILKETNLQILLIPHVLWTDQDDRIVCKALLNLYQNERITVLHCENLNYCQIRYVISKCSFFIGARTHAVISAYSVCTPSIAIGYSIKAQGIAKDLDLPCWTLVDSRNFSNNQLINSFKELLIHENDIRFHLNKKMESYKKRLLGLNEVLKKL